MSKAKLIISLEDNVVDEVPIEKEIITIGRSTDNDLCLDNLAISGYHSQISNILNDCFLEDLDSTNGTFVNSKIVMRHALKDGDIIDIGNHRIKYVNHLASSSANSEFERKSVMTVTSERNNILKEEQNIQSIEDQINSLEEQMCESSRADDKYAADSSELINKSSNNEVDDSCDIEDTNSRFEKAVASNSKNDSTSSDVDDIQINSQLPVSRIGRIQILNGKNSGKEITLEKSLTTVGRPGVAVSGITKRNTGYYIMHIDGHTKTPSKLNGEVIGTKAELIEDHDIIDVAGIKLVFFVE